MLSKKLRLIVLFATTLTFAAFAHDSANKKPQPTEDIGNGPYIGMQMGWAVNHYHAQDYVFGNHRTSYNNHFAGRIYFGYAYDNDLATEFGYTNYNKPRFLNTKTGFKDDFSMQGLDLVARASVAFKHNLGAYLKAGGTWIYRGNFAEKTPSLKHHGANNKLALLAGAAATFNFNKNWMMDLSWTRVFKNGDLANVDLFALGLNHKF